MKSFIIARQSSGDNEESVSIDSQIEECKKLCREKQITIKEIFSDYNKSGRLYPIGYENFAQVDLVYQNFIKGTNKEKQYRVGLGNALNRLDEIDYIVCYDITRLYRPLNGSFLGNLVNQKLIGANVKVITVKEGVIDFNKFTDSLITNLTSQINSEQLLIQKEKSKLALKKMKDNGEWNGKCSKSFGYRTTGRKKEVEVDEFRAEIVRKIFDMYIGGYSYYEINKSFNKEYYQKTGKVIEPTQVTRILKNPIYAGYYQDSKGNLVKAKPIIGKEIVSFDVWKKAQDILKERQIHPKRNSKNWLPLSGRIYCGTCGNHISITCANQNHLDYRCKSYAERGLTAKSSCKTSMSWWSHADEGTGLKDALYPLCALYYLHKLNKITENDKCKLEQLEIALNNLNGKSDKINKLYLEDVIDDDGFRKSMKDLNERRKKLETEINEIRDTENDSDYDDIRFISDVDNIFSQNLETDEATMALQYAVEKVSIFKDHLRTYTPFGSFDLPIRILKRCKVLPNVYEVFDEGDDGLYSVELIYCYGELPKDINYDNKGKLILNAGRLRIYLIG